ncbi:MAG: chemotaxis protein CheW [bacterium]
MTETQAKGTEASGVFADRKVKNEPQRALRVFRAGSQQFAVFADEVATIAPWRRLTPLPEAPPAVLGVVSIQGRMLTVLDPVHLVSDTTGEAPCGFIMALRGDEQLGLAIVDRPEALEVAAGEIIPPDTSNPLVFGIIQRGPENISVLNVRELFSTAIRGRERRRRRF